nr:DMT family transporter [Granulosicoccus sp.]
FPIAKHAFVTVDAFHAAIFRFSVPAVILLFVLMIREGIATFQLSGEWMRISGLGVIGMCGAPSLIFGGLMFTRPEIAAIIVATQPLMTVFAQRLLGGDRPDWISLVCVLAAFLGVVTVVTRWESVLQLKATEVAGNLMVLVGAFCWVAFTIATSRYREWSSLKVTALTMSSGAIANTVLAFTLVALGLLTHPGFNDWYEVRWEMLFLAFIGVLVAMFGWNIGAKKIGALNAMLFINLIPIVTFLVRYWQGYRFEPIELLGVAIVIAALLTQNITLRLKLQRDARRANSVTG